MIVLLHGLLLLLLPVNGFADGVVADCTQEALQTAMQAGGKVTFSCDGTIVLTNTITVAADVTLDATGHQVAISGDNRVRLFKVSSGVSFALNKLTLGNGKVVGAPGLRGEWVFGGGIFNDHGTVSLTDCALTNHQAEGGRGDTRLDPFVSGGAAFGGAICNWGGTLNLTNCLVSLNSATGGGASSQDTTFGGSGEGGALWSSNGIVNLVQTRVVGNTALGASAGGGGGNAAGGALVAVGGVVTISNSALAANVIDAGHPISGRRSSSFSVAVGGSVYLATTNTVMNCARTTFEGNTANGGYTIRPEWSDSSAGAIYNAGTLQLNECELTGNKAVAFSGEARGGALFNAGSAVLSATTVASNLALGGGTLGGGPFTFWYQGAGSGGGIFSDRAFLFCTNVTFALNLAKGGPLLAAPSNGGTGQGGGLFSTNGVVFLTHCTFASNGAAGSVAARFPSEPRVYGASLGGALYSVDGAVSVKNSLLAHSFSGSDRYNSFSGSNCFGNIIDAGHNLSSDGSCGFTANGSLNNVDPKVSALDDFGGPTRTVALLSGSPALDAADSEACPSRDQRGVDRPFGPACDIGAFESAPPYSIRGRILGGQPASEVLVSLVSAGEQSVPPAPSGVYIFNGLASGNYSVVPRAADRVFQPRSQSVNLMTDVVGLDFLSLRTNGLTAFEINEQLIHILFADAPQETYQLLTTSKLPGWESVSDFRTDADGIFEFFVTNAPGTSQMFGARKP